MMEESRLKSRTERMVENYAARLRVGQCGTPARVGDLKGQAERFAAGVARMRRIEAATAQVIDAAGVVTITRPYYYSFARKLGKLDARAWGDSARHDEGRILVDTWVARGLCREVLLRIALEVFELDLAEGKSE
jgi:hypothetical protein